MNNAQTVAPEADEAEVILLNKPLTWTSFDAVNKLKHGAKIKKIGHAGTLDPLATGLLIICTGKMTKQIDGIQAQEKEYTGTLVLGKTTPSVDLESDFDGEYPTAHITKAMMAEAVGKLTGEIVQLPPIYSAVKINGKRAYDLARAGKEVQVKPRTVSVYNFEIDDQRFPKIDFKITCSKGTYIRSMVRDFGELLQSGAYMAALCRTRIGDHKLENAWEIEAFIKQKRAQKGLD